MELTRRGEWWIARSKDRDEGSIAKAAGFWWSGGEGKNCGIAYVWYTRDPQVARKLAAYATPEARSILAGIDLEKARTVEASRSAVSDPAPHAIPVPAGLAYLPYQEAGIRMLMSRPSALLADEMGLGKTIQAIGAINADPSIASVLVICPASLRLNWRNELRKWSVRPTQIMILNGDRIPDSIPGSVVAVIANYEQIRSAPKREMLGGRTWDMMIVDESHRCKSAKTQQSGAVCGIPATWKRGPAGDWLEVSARVPGLVDISRRKLFMTGTPILNRPSDLFTTLHALDPRTWKSRHHYEVRYCKGEHTRWGWKADGADRLDELQDRLRSTLMIRRLKKDVLKDLPAKRRSIVCLPPNGSAETIKEELTAWDRHAEEIDRLEGIAAFAHASGDEASYLEVADQLRKARKIAFEDMSEVRRKIAVAKIPVAIEWIGDAIDQVGKLVVFAHHREVIDQIVAAFPEANPVKVYGEVSMKDRQAGVDRFQTDPACKLFVGSIFAAGVGITLTAAHTVGFVELDWVPANVTQAEDRCHRIGQTWPVEVYHLVLDGSLDARFVELLIKKQAIADAALDDRHAPDPLPAARPADPLPVLPAFGSVPSTGGSRDRIDPPRKYPEYPAITKARVLGALRSLAGMCDGASRRDDCGFGKFDVEVGHKLARLEMLTDGQCWLGLRLCRKYRRQVPEVADLVSAENGGAS